MLLDEFIVADCIRGGHTDRVARIQVHAIYTCSGSAGANRFETRHQEARRQVRCSMHHGSMTSGRQLLPKFVCVLRVINAIQIQRMQIVEGSNELVAPTGVSGLVLARYSMTDSLSLFSSQPFIVSNSIHYHFLPRSDNRVPWKARYLLEAFQTFGFEDVRFHAFMEI